MNTDESTFLFKSKRDQYMIQIRKQKNEMMIEHKRQKLTSGSSYRYGHIDPILQQTNLEVMQTITELAASFHEYLNSRDIPKLITIVEELRRAISNNTSPPLDHLISTGIIPHIVGLLSYEFFDETKLLVECGWIIANIASGSVKHVAYLMKLEIVPVAVSLLDHPIEDVQDNGVWILSNVAGDSIENRDLLIEMGLVEKIENTLDGNSFQPVFIGHVSWLISNLCRGKPYPSPIKVAPLMRIVEFFLKNVHSEEVQNHSMWALSYFSDGSDAQIKAVLEMDVQDKVLDFVRSDNPALKAPGLRTAGNLVTGKDEFTEKMIQAGLIEALAKSLRDEKKIFRKEACWALSNILAGKATHIEEVFNYNNREILNTLFHMIYNDDKDVARECIFCLTNACSEASVQQVQILVEFNLIEVLVETLKANNEATIVKICLEALENILNIGKQTYQPGNEGNPYLVALAQYGGYQIIEALQGHPNNEVYKVVERLITHQMEYEV